ncbi:MAG: glycosyltransferase [Planctomycetota bacterium]|jgi:dolichyl-phosphate beta-glucosyltransferase
MSGERPGLSIIVPTFREADCIADTVAEISRHFDGLGGEFEIVVCDDGSDDGTADAAQRAAAGDARARVLRLDAHRGKGAAVRAGLLGSLNGRVLVTDADLSIPLSQYAALARALEGGADIAIASKELGRRSGLVVQPFLRTLMGRVFNLAVRLVVLPALLDTQAGFKLFRGDAARELAARCTTDGFAFDVEILALARLEGLQIAEVPVSCRRSSHTSVRLIADSVRMFRDLFRIRRVLRRARGGP